MLENLKMSLAEKDLLIEDILNNDSSLKKKK